MSDVKKDRKYLGVLYPDSESYDCEAVISELKMTFPEFAYILHDSDVFTESDEAKDPCHVAGTLKKPHIHWVGRFRAARSLESVADDVGVPSYMVERCRNFDSAVRYLIHFNDPDKFQYPLDKVVATMPLTIFFRDDEDTQARSIYEYIVETKCVSMIQLTKWALDHGCWSTLRRGGSIWQAMIQENRVLDIRSADFKEMYHDADNLIAHMEYDPFTDRAEIPEQMGME